MDFDIILVSGHNTIDYGFRDNFGPNTIHYGFLPNFSSTTIDWIFT